MQKNFHRRTKPSYLNLDLELATDIFNHPPRPRTRKPQRHKVLAV